MTEKNIIPDKIHPNIWNGGMGDKDDIILYALNQFSPLPREEFISKMNKNVFHNHAKNLKKNGYIDSYREEGGRRSFYKITPLGESEALKRMYKYNLDFETLLQIELNKNVNLTKKFGQFFEDNDINDIEIQLEYINLASYITYDKLKGSYPIENQFNKLLLYIVFNHPKFYTKYNVDIIGFKDKINNTSSENLTIYQIGFFLEKVIDDNIYGIKFHKLEVDSSTNDFYFSENGYYGEIFKNTVDNYLKNLFLIGNLTDRNLDNESLMKTYGDIAFDLVERFKLFHPDLKNSLYDLINRYRKNIKEQIIKEAPSRIEDYSTILGLPDTPELLIIERIREKERTSNEKNSITKENLLSYNFGASGKTLQFVSKENVYAKAWDFYEKREYVRALENINKLLEIEKSAEIIYWKSEVIGSKLKLYDAALNIIEEGIKINPMPSGYNFYRLKAQILSEKKHYKKALKSIEKAIEIDSQPELLRTKVEILLELEKYNDLVEIVNTVPSSIRKLISSDISKETYKFKDNYDMISKILEIAILYNPESYYCYYKKAKASLNEHLTEDALEHINKSINFAENQRELNINPFYELKGKLLREKGMNEEAVKVFEKAKNRIRDENPLPLEISEIVEGIMTVEEILNEYDDLINNFGEKNLNFFTYKAKYLQKLERFDEAGEMYEFISTKDINQNDPAGPDYIFEWFEMLLKIKNFEKALYVLEQKDQYGLLYGEIDMFIKFSGFNTFLELLPDYFFSPSNSPKFYLNAVLTAIENGSPDTAKQIIKIGFSHKNQDNDNYNLNDFNHDLSKEFTVRIQIEIKKENYQKVNEFLDNFQDYNNQEPEIFRYRAVTFLRQESLSKALENINKAISLEDNNLKFFQLQTLIYIEMSDYKNAILTIDKLIDLDPNNPNNYGFKAEIFNNDNKPLQAYKALLKGREISQNKDLYFKTMSEVLERLGKNEEALKEIERAIVFNPDGYWVYYKKAYILNKMEKYEDALIYIDKALEFEPHDFVLIQDKLSILQNMKRIDEAIKLFNQESEYVVFPPDTFKQFKAQLLRDKAYNLMESGEKDEAIKMIKEAIELQPDWPEYIQPYGEILMHFGEYEAALEQLERANSLPFRPLKTPIQIGICLYELGRYMEALENLNLGKNSAQYSVKSVITTDDGKTVTIDAPQTELIEEAEKYILEVEKKLKKSKKPEITHKKDQ